MALKNFDAKAGVAFHAVMRFHGADHVLHPLHHSPEAEHRHAVGEAVAGPMPHLVREFGAADQCLGRNATVVQAVAAHFVRFHQRHPGLDHGGNVGCDQSARARANHDQVAVKARRTHRLPARIHLVAPE